MKSIVLIFLSLLALTGCDVSNSRESSSSGSDLILPGKDRIWWYEWFEGRTETETFVKELKNAGKNGDFHFGLSDFSLPENYTLFSSQFFGYIDQNYSNKENILNSTYKKFWITNRYVDLSAPLSDNFDISLSFYPFHSELDPFFKSTIDFNYVDPVYGAYRGVFAYNQETILEVKIGYKCKELVDKEEMVEKLISNYTYVV